MKILIDNGHGLNTLGKRSPDGTLIEAAYTRKIGRIVSYLTDRGYDAELLVPEDEDISLSERVKRVNAISSSCPAQTGHLAPNVILISIHINTAGNGSKWTNATGWSVYTCKGQTASDHLADCLCQAAIKNFPGRRIRTDYSDGDHDWEENFFMDGLDFEFLQSKACKQAIVDTHIEGIIEYIESTQSDSILRNLTTT